MCGVAAVLFAWSSLGTNPNLSDVSSAFHIVALGGRSTPLVTDAGEVWRLLSCHFVHTSGLHLSFNLFVLFAVGGALEHACRRVDYGALLLWVAIVSSLASLVGTPQVSAGSSGIVFGVLAAAVTFGLRHHDRLGPTVRRYFGTWVLPFLVVLFVVGLRNPGIDHASHLGGLCAGLAAGLLLPINLPALVSEPAFGKKRISVRLTAVSVCVLLGLLVGPRLVGAGRQQTVVVAPGISASVPARWILRDGKQGAREFSTAGGMVSFAVAPVPSRYVANPRAWYERQRMDTWVPTRRPAVDDAPLMYVHRNEGITMIRTVQFVHADEGEGVLAFTFDTPAQWHHKYAETRAAVLGSMRRTDARTTLTTSTAALH